jgi:hypothetical protein
MRESAPGPGFREGADSAFVGGDAEGLSLILDCRESGAASKPLRARAGPSPWLVPRLSLPPDGLRAEVGPGGGASRGMRNRLLFNPRL